MEHPESFIALNIALAFGLAACSSEPTATSEEQSTADAAAFEGERDELAVRIVRGVTYCFHEPALPDCPAGHGIGGTGVMVNS